MTNFHGDEAKKIFFEKKKIKMADSKKGNFSKSARLNIFVAKLSGMGPWVSRIDLMQRALMWLNLYGREAVRHKLKNSVKTQKRHFLAVLDLMSDSLTAI